ncbi:MAG: serine--tRNA ligase, partial [Candidatus Nealsonbacteria bacterium]
MLDINFIRQNPEKVKEGCKKKQVEVDIDKLLELDKKRREILKELERLRHQRNLISEKKTPTSEEINKARQLKEKIKSLKESLKSIEKDFKDLMFQVPNLPLPEVPEGEDETENVVIRKVGNLPKFDFKIKDHLEIGESLDIIDVERAAKVAGTRFGYLKNEAVLLEFSLIKFAFDKLIKKGFRPILPPVMMKPVMMRGMGYIEQTDKEEAYY